MINMQQFRLTFVMQTTHVPISDLKIFNARIKEYEDWDGRKPFYTFFAVVRIRNAFTANLFNENKHNKSKICIANAWKKEDMWVISAMYASDVVVLNFATILQEKAYSCYTTKIFCKSEQLFHSLCRDDNFDLNLIWEDSFDKHWHRK